MYLVVIFCSIRIFFTLNITNFNNYLICYEIANIYGTLVCSEISSGFGPAFCCNESVYLHCGFIGLFMHGAGFRLVVIFERILVFEVLF